MKRFLTPLPIGIVLADLIYGFVSMSCKGLNLQQTAANQSGTISVTPDIAFNSLQIVAKRRHGLHYQLRFDCLVPTQPSCITPTNPAHRHFPNSQPVGCFGIQHFVFVGWLHAALSLLSGHMF